MSTVFQLAGELSIDQSSTISGDVEPDYIFDLKLTSDLTRLLASASNNNVYIFDTKEFKPLSSINQAHTQSITALSTSRTDPNSFFTSSLDGTVKGWDIRTNNNIPMLKIALKEEVNAMSVNMQGCLLSSAINNEVLFFDVRKSANQNAKSSLGRYSDTHSDMVTQLEFSPNSPNCLLSGGEDGLMCIYDTSAAESEDAVVSILNAECPIRKLGYFGPNFEGIYCLSTVETASFWHFPSAQRLAKFDDIREQLNANYLVDCMYNEQSQQLYIQAGNYEGAFSINAVEPGKLTASSYSYSNHNAMLRCNTAVPNFISNPLLNGFFTGGEDGRISYWKAGLAVSSVMSDLPINEQHSPVEVNQRSKILKATIPTSLKASSKVHSNRYKPY